MTYEENEGSAVPPRRTIPHYHGDGVQIIFVIGAVVLIVAQSTGAVLPLSTGISVIIAILLVIMAGITNPAQYGIHWMNAGIAILGTLVFGTSAINHYRARLDLFDPSFVYIETIALLSLFALYFTTRTIRGMLQRPNLS